MIMKIKYQVNENYIMKKLEILQKQTDRYTLQSEFFNIILGKHSLFLETNFIRKHPKTIMLQTKLMYIILMTFGLWI